MNIIPKIHLHVSTDVFYDLLKHYVHGFGWETEIKAVDLQPVQRDVLEFLVEQFKKNQMGQITIVFSCTKVGKPESKEVLVTRVVDTAIAYRIGDSY